jgi:hypothetical protein
MAKMGRPLKFKTVKELQEKIDAYFADTPKEEWTVTGLAIALDTYRDVLIEYQSGMHDDEDKDYSNAIKRAKLKVENGYEIDLKKKGHTGSIFALKNFGWTDKKEVEHSGGLDNTNTEVTPEMEKLRDEYEKKLKKVHTKRS